MILRPRTQVALALAAALLGCASPPPVVFAGFDASMLNLPLPPAGAKARGAVQLRLDEATRSALSTIERRRTLGPIELRLASGLIVEGAALAALADEFESTAPGSGDFVLELLAVRFDLDDHIVYFVPVPVPVPMLMFAIQRIDLDSRLSLDARLLDARGRVQWARQYDSGREPPARGPLSVGSVPEFVPVSSVQQAAHDQVFKLLRAVARDVRTWVENERAREREF